MTLDEVLIYLLIFQDPLEAPKLVVEPCLVHLLKNKHYSKPRPLSGQDPHSLLLMPQDQQIVQWLNFLREQSNIPSDDAYYPLTGNNGVELLQQLLQTGRCFWTTTDSPPLRLGEARKAQLEWLAEPNGLQRLHCRVPGQAITALPLTPPWYIDHTNYTCGLLETGLDPQVISALLSAPPLKPDQIKQMLANLAQRPTTNTVEETPKRYKKVRQLQANPVPQLFLSTVTVMLQPTYASGWRPYEARLPLAELSFSYNKHMVRMQAPELEVSYIAGNEMIKIARQSTLEQNHITQLKQLGCKMLAESPDHPPLNTADQNYWLLPEYQNPTAHLEFMLKEFPNLRNQGWQITVAENYPFRLIEDSDDWYSSIQEETNNSWFDFELGITVQGEKINLLPILLNLIQNNRQFLSSSDTIIMAQLPDGHYLPIPRARIQNILNILTELHENDSLNGANQLRLSRLRAGQILDLQNIIGRNQLHWLGGEHILKLGEQLRNFTGLKEITPPEGFKTTLRHYQQEGLNWLQFLREFHLAGILADDMGLGKTVQTLAHLLVEKQAGRITKPCLLIVPTSLIANWRLEAERFAPVLKILTLHGQQRQRHFSALNYYDLIITTYPLLVRDQQTLLDESYYYLILDEAQIIKNPYTKVSQIVQRIQCSHRLCLTGTPMENHLGELWSLFHFLLPGLLGDHEQFKRLFQIPIEKNNDNERRQSLKQRVAPFLLRRTKEAVIKELPAKTEIIRPIELEDAQRDLYEGIRIAMHQQVIQAIHDKGIANSHIAILDALLKLRQICCDPRLLKLSTTQHLNVPSAKLLLLMEMLPNLIAEGRKILLFSQFTEMLDLIEQEICKENIPFVTLTGQTKDRQSVIESFQGGDIPLFLISLKAGGIGLNLTAADTVIHYDPWWNPAVENQATDRVHRIGQDKPIFVYKLVTCSTVEEKILELQRHKQALLDSLFDPQGQTKFQLSKADLEALFAPLS